MNDIYYKDYLNNINELIKLSKNDNFVKLTHNKKHIIINIDNYITFLKDNLNINHNELLLIVDLTIYNKYNSVFKSTKDYYKNYDYYIKNYKKLFMYNYNMNIKYLKKIIKVKKRDFASLINHLNNKKRVYLYFDNINNTNIQFYLPLILELESNS